MRPLDLRRTEAALNAPDALPRSVSARQQLLASLVCPGCAQPLVVAASGAGGSTVDLACRGCDRRWPLRQRTPNFNPQRREWVPPGPAALLRAPDVERWDGLRRSLQCADAVLYAEVFDSARDRWLTLLPLPDGCQALVLGCGWGRVACSLARLCARVYAVDPDNLRARFVNARAFAEGHDNLLAVTATSESLPVPAGGFDIVVVEDAAAFAADASPRRALPDLVRARALITPDGLLLLRCGADPSNVLAHGPSLWARAWQKRRWARLLTEAGFACVERVPSRARPTCPADAHRPAIPGVEMPAPRLAADTGASDVADCVPTVLTEYLGQARAQRSRVIRPPSVRALLHRYAPRVRQPIWLLARTGFPQEGK